MIQEQEVFRLSRGEFKLLHLDQYRIPKYRKEDPWVVMRLSLKKNLQVNRRGCGFFTWTD